MSEETPERPEESPIEDVPKKRPARKRTTPVKNVRRATGASREAREKSEDAGSSAAREDEHEREIDEVIPALEAREEGFGIDEDSSEPIAVIVEPPGSEGQGQGSKKRRRRRKKSGQQGEGSEGGGEFRAPSGPAPTNSAPFVEAAPRAKANGDRLGKKAWQIYLAEVSEEGVALIGDQDARELSRRCFRLAEIFLDEAGRHR